MYIQKPFNGKGQFGAGELFASHVDKAFRARDRIIHQGNINFQAIRSEISIYEIPKRKTLHTPRKNYHVGIFFSPKKRSAGLFLYAKHPPQWEYFQIE